MITSGALYEGCHRANSRLVERLPRMTAWELGLQGVEGWPVWALISHLAGARVYWLCGIFGEPGAETTPFDTPLGEGWEDHLDHPRGADELLLAVTSSWRIVESCLERWTPDQLGVSFPRRRGDRVESHSRASVLTRLVMHDAFHCGEISLLLGMNGREALDPWGDVPPRPAC
jgi:hypothetical protein